jgi:hypothetical protein
MSLADKKTQYCNAPYDEDFSALSMAARIEIYEEMIFQDLRPDLHSLLAGLSEEEEREILSEFGLVSAIIKDAESLSSIGIFDD